MKKKLAIAGCCLAACVCGAVLVSHGRGASKEAEYSVMSASADDADREYGFEEAPKHIGERARVKGKVLKVFTAKSGVTFLDFCSSTSKCPFSAVIFASDAKKFGDVKRYVGEAEISGVIRSYKGSAEIVLDDPSQIKVAP